MGDALYIAVVHKATGLTPHEIRWELALADGWAYYHAQRLLDGDLMTWPQHESTEDGRWWQNVKRKLQQLWQTT